MQGNWLALLELLVVFAVVLGWGVLELVALRLDRKRQKQDPTARPDDEPKT